MKRLQIKDDGDKNGGAVAEADNSCLFPDRPGEPDCIYYLRTGTCSYGSQCRFNHPPYSPQVFSFWPIHICLIIGFTWLIISKRFVFLWLITLLRVFRTVENFQ